MADTRADIPDRDIFKASEVCEIAGVQPYVLRSWEQEFPSLGTSRTPGAPRAYRRGDVEMVLRIRALVFGEGLTLAGARRRIEDEDEPAGHAPAAPVAVPETRERIESIRRDLRSLLTLLDRPSSGGAAKGAWPPTPAGTVVPFSLDAGADGADGEAGGPQKAVGGKKKGARPSKRV